MLAVTGKLEKWIVSYSLLSVTVKKSWQHQIKINGDAIKHNHIVDTSLHKAGTVKNCGSSQR